MNLVVIAALVAACGAAQLDRTYLPPPSANTAGGGPGSLHTPLTRTSEQERGTPRLPTGSYTNNFGGVVVDAAAPGTRAAADADQSGLGNPRPSYGSSNSKVGDAAFRGFVAGFRDLPSFGAPDQTITHGQSSGPFDNSFSPNAEIDTHTNRFSPKEQEVNGQIGSHAGQFSTKGQNFQNFAENKPERPQAAKDRNSNILALSNEVNPDSYSYGFETDNGITVGENGVAVNGVQAEGGYSYRGDDGQVYKVTYTADEGGYRPQGAHLPTPPPIPEDILKSLERNAKEEAAGIVDDGSYDAQKYNADGDYTHDNGGDIQHNGAQLSQFEKRPESDATAVGSFNQNSQTFGSASAGVDTNSQNAHLAYNGQSSQVNGNTDVGQFGVATNAQHSLNGQSAQPNGKPGSTQFGATGSQSDALAAQVNHQPASAHTGTGHQSSHSIFEQSSFVDRNQYKPTSTTTGGSQSGHSSRPLSEHDESSVTGQTFEQNTGNQFTISLNQAQAGYEGQIGSQFGQQALASAQYENHSPKPSSQTNQQGSNAHFGSKPLKPVFHQSASSSLPSQPQFGSSFKPQGSEAFSGASLNQDQDTQDYGKPSPQTFSGQNFNRPSVGSFSFNKITSGQMQNMFGSATAKDFNRVPQTAGQFEANNEYLPPFSLNDQSRPKKPEPSTSGPTSPLNLSGLNSNSQEPEQKDQVLDFVALNRPSFASAAASTSSFGQSVENYQPQPAKPLNAINDQSQLNQFAQPTSLPSSLNSAQFNKDSQQFGTFSSQSVPDFGSKPTTVPDTELTTPLEPNEAPNSQSSQLPSQTNFDNFGSKPVGDSPAQAQFSFQGNSAFGEQSNSQNLPPSFPTSSSETATAPSSNEGPNPNLKPGFSQNSFGQNQQNQQFINQGFDNSYYYNQPSNTFKTPPMRPQGSRFPNSPAHQSNGVVSKNQFFNQQSFQSSAKFPAPPSLAPVRPTATTQFAYTQNYNGITQAAISPFPSASPTPSSQFGTTQRGQFNQQATFGNQKPYPQRPTSGPLPATPQVNKKPTLFGSQSQTQIAQSLSESTPGSSDSSPQQQPTQTQQYQGTVYEYNKPAEVLPASTQTDSSSAQTIQAVATPVSNPALSSQAGYSNPKSQQNGIQFGSQPPKPFKTPSSSSFNSQFSQSAQSEPQPFGASSISTHSGQLTPGLSSSQQNKQGLQTAQSPKPYGSASQSSQSSFGAPQFGSRIPQLSQNTQILGNSQPSQPESGTGSQTQFSSQTFQNTASSQDNGYFYPGFAGGQNQFSQNSQPDKPQSGSNQFNQNSLGNPAGHNQQSSPANLASNPQFGAQTQDDREVQAAFSQPAFGQSIASSQVLASGQGTASATASSAQQKYEPLGSQNQKQYGQNTNQQQSGQGSQLFGTQDFKAFGTNTRGSGVASKPLFNSACCQNSKDSTPAQTSASFQGTQGSNAQGVAGEGEQFGGPRQPPRFDDRTGYHY